MAYSSQHSLKEHLSGGDLLSEVLLIAGGAIIVLSLVMTCLFAASGM